MWDPASAPPPYSIITPEPQPHPLISFVSSQQQRASSAPLSPRHLCPLQPSPLYALLLPLYPHSCPVQCTRCSPPPLLCPAGDVPVLHTEPDSLTETASPAQSWVSPEEWLVAKDCMFSRVVTKTDTILLLIRLLLVALPAILVTSLPFAFVSTTRSPGNLLYALFVHRRFEVRTECDAWAARVDCSTGAAPLLEALQVPLRVMFFQVPLEVFLVAVISLVSLRLSFRESWGRWRGAAIVGAHLAVPVGTAVVLVWVPVISLRALIPVLVCPVPLCASAMSLLQARGHDHKACERLKHLLLVCFLALVPFAISFGSVGLTSSATERGWPWYVVVPFILTVLRCGPIIFEFCLRFGPEFPVEFRLLCFMVMSIPALTRLRTYIAAQSDLRSPVLSVALMSAIEVLQCLGMLLWHRWRIRRMIRQERPKDAAFLQVSALLLFVTEIVAEHVSIVSSAALQLALDPRLYSYGGRSPTASLSLAGVALSLALQLGFELVTDTINLLLFFSLMQRQPDQVRKPMRLPWLLLVGVWALCALNISALGPDLRRGCLTCSQRDPPTGHTGGPFYCPVACAD